MSKPSLLHVVKSVIAGLIGVQSEANREQDFQHGLPVYLCCCWNRRNAVIYFGASQSGRLGNCLTASA